MNLIICIIFNLFNSEIFRNFLKHGMLFQFFDLFPEGRDGGLRRPINLLANGLETIFDSTLLQFFYPLDQGAFDCGFHVNAINFHICLQI